MKRRLSKTHLGILRAAVRDGVEILYPKAERHIRDLGNLVGFTRMNGRLYVRPTDKGRAYLRAQSA